jgi:hypothetical protein
VADLVVMEDGRFDERRWQSRTNYHGKRIDEFTMRTDSRKERLTYSTALLECLQQHIVVQLPWLSSMISNDNCGWVVGGSHELSGVDTLVALSNSRFLCRKSSEYTVDMIQKRATVQVLQEGPATQLISLY